MDAELLQQILTAFSGEAGELLDGLNLLVEALRTARGSELAAKAAAAMRLAHTLKGGAASVGLPELASEAHALEDLLAPLSRGERNHAEDLVPAVVEHLARSHALLREGLAARAAMEQYVRSSDELEAPAPSGASGHRPGGASEPGELSLRVEASRLDALMGLAGDLLSLEARLRLNTRRLDELAEALADAGAKLPEAHRAEVSRLAAGAAALHREERLELSSLARLLGDLGAAVRGARVIPLASAAPGWRRTTLEAAHALGKQVALRVEVGEVGVDKRVLDAVREPVSHLLRNAVSHGVEAAAARAAAGKPAEGHVLLRAEVDGGVVRLEVCDDGAGFNLARLAEAAVAAGRVDATRVKQLRDDEVVALAFEPGLSTATELTQVSGRGVGLDVVRQALGALGGSVEPVLRGPLGGAAFRLTLPLDVLSTRVLLVRAGGVTWALPIAQVERTLRVRPADVHSLDGVPTARLDDGAALSLAWLREEDRAEAQADWLRVVVVAQGGARLGVVVAEVLREDELVLRPLPWNLRQVPGVTGAAPLADGSVAVVVDGLRLRAAQASAPEAPRPRTRRVLVVDDSLTHRTLAQNILAAAGYEVTVAPDGLAGWRALEDGQFDLLVSDVEMPGLDGLELTRRVRGHARLARLPVILVTSRESTADVERGLAAGATEYVVKRELDSQKLLSAVTRHL